MNTDIQTGEWLGISNEDYHARYDHVSVSMLKVFAENTARYHGLYIARTIDKPKPTAAMELGTLVHTLVLQPETWGKYRVAPKCDKRTTVGRELWNSFVLTIEEGQVIVDGEQFTQAQKIAAAVLAHDEASQLLALESPWPNEHAIWWRDGDDGLLCKSMADKRTPGILIDLKTCADGSPRGFAKAADTFRYDWQAAFYLRGHYEFTAEKAEFYFIAVETSPPHTVAVHRLDPFWIELAGEEVQEAMTELSRRQADSDWQPAHAKGVNTLQRPRWAAYRSEYQE